MVRADDRPIRDRLALIADPKARTAARVAEVAAVLPDLDRGVEVARGDLALRFQRAPQFIRNRTGEIIGIDAMVRVFRDGLELHVDPHRVCINPPCTVPDGTVRSVEVFLGLTSRTIEVANVEENPREAYLQWLEDSIRATPNPAGWGTRGTVTTVFSTTADGYVLSYDVAYAPARAGTGTFLTDSIASNNAVGQDLSSGFYQCAQFFVSWDTSAIPDTDAISAAVLSLYGNNDFSVTDFTIEARAHDWGVAVASADFVAGASLGGLTLLATFNTAGGISTSAYNDFTESGTNLQAAVNKTGETRIVLNSSRQRLNNAPTGVEFVFFYQAEADGAGTTRDPQLVITHAAGAVSVPGRVVSINQSVKRAATW